MTKLIRVENACTSPFKAVVEVWDKGQTGDPDVLVQIHNLYYPASMTPGDLYITSTRYLVVKEL